MISTGIDKRVQIQQIVDNQLPEFVLSESPKAVDFLKQYYISQEYRGGPVDITDNLDQYLKLNNLTPETIVGYTTITSGIGTDNETINVDSTKGFPDQYGLFKIDDEIITYTGLTTNSFTGCVRGFSGITTYHQENNPGELVFSKEEQSAHLDNSRVQNLSALFLKEFYNKIKFSLTPGLENSEFVPQLNVNNFIKEARSFYESKGTEESFRILFQVLYGVDPKVIDLEEYLVKPSSAKYVRRERIIAEKISGDPLKLRGQTITKITDSFTSASISEVEYISGISTTTYYYSLDAFIGYDDEEYITGTFDVPGKTKSIGDVSIGSSVITVDSTVGFGATGTLVSGINTHINYTDKTINQFLNCTWDNQNTSGIITSTTDVRSNDTIIGYENGDISKPVELRITGVLAEFIPDDNTNLVIEGERILVKSLGENIENPITNKTNKEVHFNSWIYNSAASYECTNKVTGTFENATLPLKSSIDRSSLKVGDTVEVLYRTSNELDFKQVKPLENGDTTSKILSIDTVNNEITLDKKLIADINRFYNVRRVLNKANSKQDVGAPIKYGNNTLTVDIQNTYNEADENIYVASNSLPSYEIEKNISEIEITSVTASGASPSIQGYDAANTSYNILSFPEQVPFVTGDAVVYTKPTDAVGILTEGVYYVENLSETNKIKLYPSQAFIASGIGTIGFLNAIGFGNLPSGITTDSIHKFTLLKHHHQEIDAQRLLKKYPLSRDLKSSESTETTSGPIGMLINGVQIENSKSEDGIFYGPIDNIKIATGGHNYDVINPPNITIGTGAGTTALSHVVVRGDIKKIQIDPQDFDVDEVRSVKITGGNAKDVVLNPVVKKRNRELEFNGKLVNNGGDVDSVNETLKFQTNHNLRSGDVIVYNNNGFPNLGIGTFKGDDNADYETLDNGTSYWVQSLGISSVFLYRSEKDYTAGINTVGFTAIAKEGMHKFRLKHAKNTLTSVDIINGGTFENRQVSISAVGISTVNSTFTFKNHGFSDGELVDYRTSGTSIGISTDGTGIQYKIIKIDDDSFRLANAGVGGTLTSDYITNNYSSFTNKGTGYQIIKYPDITVSVDAAYRVATSNKINLTPIISGKIVDVILYEKGTGYGTTDVINYDNSPNISIKNGLSRNTKLIQPALRPIVASASTLTTDLSGEIIGVQINSGGDEYFSTPELIVEGDGFSAELRPIIDKDTTSSTYNRIIDVKVLNRGTGYTQDKTTIKVVPAGSGAIFDAFIRKLNLNSIQNDAPYSSKYTYELLSPSRYGLRYSLVGYSTDIGYNNFNDTGATHSPIIGWAYDGNPIYGPWGYIDPLDSDSDIQLLDTGYSASVSNIEDRPPSFSAGFFAQDFVYSSGDLDIHNGRYCKTPEYPDGTYAYFVGVTTNFATGKLDPKYPYFIGDSYKSNPTVVDEVGKINQDYDFNNSNLIRNSFPYKVSGDFDNNDYIINSDNIQQQLTTVDSVTQGTVESLQVINSGDNYKVGDDLTFDNDGTNGSGLSAFVDSIKGKSIQEINTTYSVYDNVDIIWKDSNTVSAYISTSHSLLNGDNVVISGVTTSAIKGLTGSHRIGVTTTNTVLYKEVTVNHSVGVITDIFVGRIPELISIGSSIGIGTENLEVINKFEDRNILRVRRGVVGTAHTVSSLVNLIPSFVDIPLKVDYFESQLDDIVYFNPREAIGICTIVGLSSSVNVSVGDTVNSVDVPCQSIYLPNHPFKKNQQITLNIPSTGSNIAVSTDGTVPGGYSLTNNTNLYVINKSSDYIGVTSELQTSVGTGNTTENGLFFLGNGAYNFEYSFQSNFSQVQADIETISAKVALTTSHTLPEQTIVDLIVEPTQSVGIATTGSYISLLYNSSIEKLVINPISFTSGINTVTDSITLTSHGLKTGDKVYYSGDASITDISQVTRGYFVYRIDDNNIQLCKTYKDSTVYPPINVDFTTTGSNNTISLINPPISIIKNNSLVFDVKDSSLSGYNLKFYIDNEFKNEFVSTGSTSLTSVTSEGTIGSGTTATVTLNYSEFNPPVLYYNLEKSGFISTSDIDVVNGSKVYYDTHEYSEYNGRYSIIGVGDTSFNILLRNKPNVLKYAAAEDQGNSFKTGIGTIRYTTKSTYDIGPVENIGINFGGIGYKKLPEFVSVASTQGTNAQILPRSTTANKIKEATINNIGFEYPSDKTLLPIAQISPIISLRDYNVVKSIEILDGGRDYQTDPTLLIIDANSRKPNFSGSIIASVSESTQAIESIKIVSEPKGIDVAEAIALDNTNGITVTAISVASTVVTDTNSGVVTFTLATPVNGFSTAYAYPFAVGDTFFIEDVENEWEGDTINSANNGYSFYTITNTNASKPALTVNPFQFEFNLLGICTNPGLAKTTQTFASVVNYNRYPKFKITQEAASFSVNERVLVYDGEEFRERNLIVDKIGNDYIKILGKYQLKVNDIIKGSYTGSIATINQLSPNTGKFKVDYSSRREIGWIDNIGKLNEDYQVIPDNDYYQTLSYTVKSPIEYQKLLDPVNSLVHTSGLKNFADTTITQVSPKIGIGSVDVTTINRDLSSTENRIDAINNFDLVRDDSILTNPQRSKYIQFRTRELVNYFKCLTNRVLDIDNISPLFSNASNNIKTDGSLSLINPFGRFLVQARNPSTSAIQFTEVLTSIDYINKNIYTIQKGVLGAGGTTANYSELVDIEGDKNEVDVYSLKFNPVDIYDADLDIKVFENTFSSATGVGTDTSLGFVSLTGINNNAGSSSSISLVSSNISDIESYFASIEVRDNFANETNIFDFYVTHDGTNSYVANYSFETNTSNFIGTFTSQLDSNILSLNYENDRSNNVSVQSRVVGFGTTAAGIGTYRFKTTAQPDGSENSLRIQSSYSNVSTSSTILEFNKTKVSSVKNVIRASIGNTSAIHQIMMAHDGTDAYIVQYPFISIGSTSGIGTFTSQLNGSDFELVFHPDISGTIQIQSYSEVFNTDIDLINIPSDLTYGAAVDSQSLIQYDSLNGDRADSKSFKLRHKNVPIFGRYIDPQVGIALTSGIVTIENHFFNDKERIIYTPGSSIEGVGIASIQTDGNPLPSELYVIKIDDNQFNVALSQADANAGIGTTFTSFGTGNYHLFEMFKKNEKSLITLDNIIQTPLSYTPVTTTLSNNVSGQVSISTTVLGIAGISSIILNDILKIGEEYVKVNNVGYAITNLGPVGVDTGTIPMIEVERGFVGSSATTHADADTIRLYKGGFNIVGDSIYFSEAPRGTNVTEKTESNRDAGRSDFSGRVYLRNDYSTNAVFDDVSTDFTGVGRTFTTTIGGANTIGLSTGSSLVVINGIFQNPTTETNLSNNYTLDGNDALGITSFVFSGITSANGSVIISEDDINQNQLPRKGDIISIGSSGGLGIAPLVGASVTAVLAGAGQSIVSVGLGTTDFHGSGYNTGGTIAIGVTDIAYEHRFVSAGINSLTANAGGPFTVTDATFDSSSGVMVLTIPGHGLTISNTVGIVTSSIGFTCESDNYTTTKLYPRLTDPAHNATLAITAVTTDTITVGVGSAGGSGTGAVITATVVDYNEHTFVSAVGSGITANAGGPFTANAADYDPVSGILTVTTTATHGFTSAGFQTATNAIYNPVVGIVTIITTGNHGYSNGDYVKLAENSLTFTCAKDGNQTNHSYPRRTDPIFNKWIQIADVTSNTFEIEVLNSTPSTDVSAHTYVSAAASGIQKANNTVGIGTSTLTFTCAQDMHTTTHSYPRPVKLLGSVSDPAHNATLGIEEVLSTTQFTVNVGRSPAGTGGALKFTVGAGGTGYINPRILPPSPSYNNLPIQGISRLGLGPTTDTGRGLTVNVDVAAAATTGIGSNLYEVSQFDFPTKGTSFRKGDIFRPVGLVTDRLVYEPSTDFRFTVNEVFTDAFGSWNVGEFDFIDSIERLQNGVRKRFPLKFNGELVAFRADTSSSIDVNNLLLIFVNGVLQEPEFAYSFYGGTSFIFTEAPDENDKVTIFFYKGSNDDISFTDVTETVKEGDEVQIMKRNGVDESVTQNKRTIIGITTSDVIETNLYYKQGIDENNYRPLKWIKQKTDKVIGGNIIYKSRLQIEPLIYPNAGIISDIQSTDDILYVDSVDLFEYDSPVNFDLRIVDQSQNPERASLTAVVSAAGTVQSITVNSGGVGYVGVSTSISIGIPPTGISTFVQADGSIGIGTTATATATITGGVISSVDVVNPGLGYTTASVPQVIAPLPILAQETISDVSDVKGFSGIITGISTTSGTGSNPLALHFFLEKDTGTFGDLENGYPIYIFNTSVGSGVTSHTAHGTPLGIGATFLDNIYQINSINRTANKADFIANVDPNANIVGIGTTGMGIGKFSWGRLTGFSRSSNPVSIAVSSKTVSGLSTFPHTQRRDSGIRKTGAIKNTT